MEALVGYSKTDLMVPARRVEKAGERGAGIAEANQRGGEGGANKPTPVILR